MAVSKSKSRGKELSKKQNLGSFFSKRKVLVGIVALMLAISFVAGAYYLIAQSRLSGRQSTDELVKTVEIDATDSSEQVLVLFNSDDLYTINLPKGWKKVDEEKNSKVNQLTVRYENLNGDYLVVNVNPIGYGFSSDETWEAILNSSQNGILINKKWTPCGQEESGFCSKGDNKFTIGVKVGESIKSNNYFFLVGNDNQESRIDANIYKKILESIVFK